MSCPDYAKNWSIMDPENAEEFDSPIQTCVPTDKGKKNKNPETILFNPKEKLRPAMGVFFALIICILFWILVIMFVVWLV